MINDLFNNKQVKNVYGGFLMASSILAITMRDTTMAMVIPYLIFTE